MSEQNETAIIYDSIVESYAAAKTNPFKVYVEEPTFLLALGDISNQNILDLACGSGHYSRLFKKLGAAEVHGVDVSATMIEEGRRIESDAPLGITYTVQDLSLSRPNSQASLAPKVDIVTAAFLLPYASDTASLHSFCKAAADSLSSGGRFVGITMLYSDIFETSNLSLHSSKLCWGVTWLSAPQPGFPLLVEMTLLNQTKTQRVTFPNYLWSKADTEAGAGV